MRSGVVVVGSHTDVGKTFVSCALVRALVARGIAVTPRKPVLTGVGHDDEALADSDAGRLLAATGRRFDRASIDEVAPLRFALPQAPDAAARAEGRRLRLADVVAAAAAPEDAYVLIETAGGVMSPVADDGLVVDVAAALGLPCVLVVGAYLGGISHGLSAHAVLLQRGLVVAAVVVNRADGGVVTDAHVEPFARFLPGQTVLSSSDETWTSVVIARLGAPGAATASGE
jgi:dethiobiotin synthetase